MLDKISGTAAADVQSGERIQSIHVRTEYLGAYQSVNHIRDLPDLYLDEPKELGGKNTGPTPLETVLAALNSCTAMIMNILRKEMRFDLKGARFETDGYHDVRRIEMKRTGKLFSEVEPIAYHYYKVAQTVFIRTAEPDDRLEHFRREVERLCPVHALLRDAKVPMEMKWIRES